MVEIDQLVTRALNRIREFSEDRHKAVMAGLPELEYRQAIGFLQGLDFAGQILIEIAKEVDYEQ